MLNLFKTKETKDFERAMDFLECSRTLMSCTIETHRSIEECDSEDFVSLLKLVGTVKPTDEFLKNNLFKTISRFDDWRLNLLNTNKQRYQHIERIVNNTYKNFIVAREKAHQIDEWVRTDMSVIKMFT